MVDGAEWQRGFIDLHRADAVRILGFPHTGEYVATAGQAVFSAGTEVTTQWLREHLDALKHGAEAMVLAVLAELRQRVARAGNARGARRGRGEPHVPGAAARPAPVRRVSGPRLSDRQRDG